MAGTRPPTAPPQRESVRRTLVVIPTYEEAGNIEALLEGVRTSMPGADVLVVDDNSPDGTAALARRAGARHGRITVLDRPTKLGLGSAYRTGFAWGLDRGYEVLVEMDADLSHDPSALPGLVTALAGGVQVVVGSRYVTGGAVRGWPHRRRALSALGNRFATALLGLEVNDVTSGFRAYTADVLRQVDVTSSTATGYGFQIEMVHRVVRAGGSVVEVPIEFTERLNGRSKISRAVVLEAMILVTRWGVRQRSDMRLGRSSGTTWMPPGMARAREPASGWRGAVPPG